jgi:hypothetical protein
MVNPMPAISPPLPRSVTRTFAERFNIRMVTIVAIFSLLVGIPVYNFVKAEQSHGIEKDGDLLRVDLKSLGSFPFSDATGTIDNVPANFRQLDGKRVALEGTLVSSNVASDPVNTFQFVYNVQKCCFGGPPLVQERVYATVPNDGTIENTSGEIRLIGVLHVKVIKDADVEANKIIRLYTMDVEKAEPL